METATATIRNYGYEMQEKQEDGRDAMYRYRCSFCGKTGRWFKDGSMANTALRAHQGDSRDRTPCPNIR